MSGYCSVCAEVQQGIKGSHRAGCTLEAYPETYFPLSTSIITTRSAPFDDDDDDDGDETGVGRFDLPPVKGQRKCAKRKGTVSSWSESAQEVRSDACQI